MKNPHLYLIGLTGGIACGKSTVLKVLQAHGAGVLDADRVVHELQQPGMPVYAAIVAEFGTGILTAPDGPIDRPRLGSIVFSDPAALQRLERIVHPAVRTSIRNWLAAVAAGSADQPGPRPVAVIDAIRLIEGGYTELCNSVWVVTCREDQQIARLREHRGMSEEDALRRIAAQPPQASRMPHADVVIDNSGTLAETEAQVARAWQQVAEQRGTET
jgi:dephospho-CoA kinase